jgi:hypothetical protein
MSTTADLALQGRPSLSAMTRIEARRLARHPAFVIGTVAAFGILVAFELHDAVSADVMSWPVVPAFFIGLGSLVAVARLTRSTEGSEEAVSTAPGTEARRTTALALACFVPFTAGSAWLAGMLVVVRMNPPAPQEWWFPTVPDLHVWSVLVALSPVACLGGGLLGLLTGRWLRFPGASAVVVLVTVVGCMLSQAFVEGSHPSWRLFAPWATFQSGTNADGTAILYAGNAAFYLLYALCLCAAAYLVATWHDRSVRSGRTLATLGAVVVVGLACLGLAMTTGIAHNRTSDPIPAKVGD